MICVICKHHDKEIEKLKSTDEYLLYRIEEIHGWLKMSDLLKRLDKNDEHWSL